MLSNAERAFYDETRAITIEQIREIEDKLLYEQLDDEERFYASMYEDFCEMADTPRIIHFEDLVNPDPDPDPVEMAIAA